MSNSILLFWSFFLIPICFSYGDCINTEKEALLHFKNGLTDPSNRLRDWVTDGSDCCKWTGVVCHNITSHVLELHLRTLSPLEYFGPDHYSPSYDPQFEEYEEYHSKSKFRGKVSSSLLQLKHLSYLDLSFNDFGRIPVPEFLGSLQSLRYLNLSEAGFQGIIPPQLGNLSNLHYLNLQSRYHLYVENLDWVSRLSSLEFLNMNGVDLGQSFDWLKAINSLPSLLELHLSGSRLPSFNPTYLLGRNLSSLFVLDLSNNYFEGPIPTSLQNITSSFLRELDLSGNSFNSSIPVYLYGLNHLQLLSLRSNQLQGKISTNIRNLTSLVTLDLSFNDGLEFEQGIQNLCNLRSLHLSFIKLNQEINNLLEIMSSGCVSDSLQSIHLSFASNLTGHLTDRIGRFTNLKHLDLSDNVMIRGPIPTSFKHLCNLKSLSLSGVKLNQEINNVLAIMSECVSNGLESLRLDDCQLFGHLTDDISYFKNLTLFKVSDNSISAPIPLSIGEMVSLESIDLSNNTFNGTLPESFGDLKNLEIVYISSNELHGEVSHLHFSNLTRLVVFSASEMGKNVSLRVSSDWIPPLRLQRILLGSWHIGSQFPKWLRLLNHLEALDLSNSGISSQVPIWFWNSISKYSYYYLNFSRNKMNGVIPNISFVNGEMPLIDLSSNNFSGEVPYISSNVSAVDLSNNSFSGSIFNFLCYKMNEEKQMVVLNLEGNSLSGEIPDCWRSWKYLVAIRLSNNKFSGNIPRSFGTLSFLESLHLRNNNLSGEVPLSIRNCNSMVTLDLSENNLVGSIPNWIGENVSSLRILSLNANKFDGYLPMELCRLVSLHILDLAHNSLFGAIPSCFNNFTGMATRNDSIGSINIGGNGRGVFIENVMLVMKEKVMEYNTILRYVRSIDLSDNNLSGEIPNEMTRLEELLSLNLSHNALTGRIPNGIGNMHGLEVIDFSQNQLSGEIPNTISTLTFLSKLNLSYNELSGRIPSGTQLHGFDSSSFTGNQLCGLPLIKNCSSDGAQPDIEEKNENEDEDEDKDELDVWFYVSLMIGFVVGFWSAVGSLIFIRRWRNFYFRSLYHFREKIRSYFHRFYLKLRNICNK
ncbi:receptor-like protein EIX2 [Euphorbia lathyris]|uniref:receptor-like protein EIX2 n=1 Tax=Euphorbia lathyris TaxID=212925 RepID=UPI0033141611